MTWFGSLDLAWKYALVFGAALALTLTAGFIKVLFDKRKLSQHVKALDLEKGDSTRNSGDDQWLNMREKDEGDLFGIRAIEAGFFGGVAQSNPNSPSVSRAGSRAGSRNGSPAPSNRIPYGGYNPSPVSPQSLGQSHYNNNNHHNSHGESMISGGSSVLDQYRESVGQSSSIPSIRLSKSSTALIDHPAQVDSVFSVLSPAPAAYTPTSMHYQSPLTKLRPSHTETNNRVDHTLPESNINIKGPSSETSGQRHSLDCPLHSSSQHMSSGPTLPLHMPDRASHLSARSSIYPSPEEWEESTQGEPARLVNGPDKKGKKMIEIGSLDNPSIDETSQRGSIVSRVTSKSSKYQSPKKDPHQPPVPALRLPLFQKKAIIGASNPEFDRFRKARMYNKDDSEEADSQAYNANNRKTDPALLSAASPRTSFSFDYANSDGIHPEERAFSAQPAPKYLSRRLYASGTYNPVGAPESTHSGISEDPF